MVFFTADLDARLLTASANRSTRNLVVASGFGFKLRPGLQGGAPPFRDTYQTGVFLAVQLTLDEKAHKLKTHNFKSWFDKPRLYEVGRTRPVNLIPATLTEDKKIVTLRIQPEGKIRSAVRCRRTTPTEFMTIPTGDRSFLCQVFFP